MNNAWNFSSGQHELFISGKICVCDVERKDASMNRFKRTAPFVPTIAAMMFIFGCGLLVVWYQIISVDRERATSAAKNEVARIDSLLIEARETAEDAKVYLGMHCSTEVTNALFRLAITHDHVRVISLIKDGYVSCSSYNDFTPVRIDFARYADNKLTIRPGAFGPSDSKVLVLLNHFQQGIVATSIPLSHVQNLQEKKFPILFKSGGKLVSMVAGDVTAAMPLTPRVVVSALFPYSVIYSYPSLPTFSTLVARGGYLILLLVFLSALCGIGVWHFLSRSFSPEENLRRALLLGQIKPWYQPVICGKTGKMTGAEVLARWEYAKDEFIPPDAFIPVADQSGMSIELTRRLMEQARKDIIPLLESMDKPFHLGFNFSASHFKLSDVLISECRDFINSFPDASVILVVEITEREPFDTIPDLAEQLTALRALGVDVALDDFGTGYSNIGYLHTLPANYIKIDRSFVSAVNAQTESSVLLDCVIDMAKTLGLTIVAEGVETQYQANYLRKKGVTYLQGYYYSRPLPVQGLVEYAEHIPTPPSVI